MSGTGLARDDLPALFDAADRRAIEAQRRFLRVVGLQIGALLLGVSSGTLAGALEIDPLALVAVASFTGVAVLRVHQRTSSLEVRWYDARLAAESVKSLSWRYAMAAEPFGRGVPDREADRTLTRNMWEILGELQHATFPPAEGSGDQITEGMRRLRKASLEHRMDVYRTGRIEDQSRWYTAKANSNEVAARRWDAGFLLASAAAVFLGMLQAVGILNINLLSLAGYGAALISTWTGVKRHDRQARAYGRTAHELLAMRSMLVTVESEDEWSEFVDDAEGAISQEHSSWRSIRSQA